MGEALAAQNPAYSEELDEQLEMLFRRPKPSRLTQSVSH